MTLSESVTGHCRQSQSARAHPEHLHGGQTLLPLRPGPPCWAGRNSLSEHRAAPHWPPETPARPPRLPGAPARLEIPAGTPTPASAQPLQPRPLLPLPPVPVDAPEQVLQDSAVSQPCSSWAEAACRTAHGQQRVSLAMQQPEHRVLLTCSHLAAGLQPAQRQRGKAEVPHKVLRCHYLHQQTAACSSQWVLRSKGIHGSAVSWLLPPAGSINCSSVSVG